jgi:hypothetical protein
MCAQFITAAHAGMCNVLKQQIITVSFEKIKKFKKVLDFFLQNGLYLFLKMYHFSFIQRIPCDIELGKCQVISKLRVSILYINLTFGLNFCGNFQIFKKPFSAPIFLKCYIFFRSKAANTGFVRQIQSQPPQKNRLHHHKPPHGFWWL